MTKYVYEAIDTEGETISGTIEAESLEDATQKIEPHAEEHYYYDVHTVTVVGVAMSEHVGPKGERTVPSA